MMVGMNVEVLTRFQRTWARGFRIARVLDDDDCSRYEVERRVDGVVLPTAFVTEELRPEI
jgi:hypothetical protein